MHNIVPLHLNRFLLVDEDAVQEAKKKIGRLSRRELEVLHFIVAGEPNKIIAHILGISTRTVENHRLRISEKTDCKSLSALVSMFTLGAKDCLPYCALMKKCNHTHNNCPIEHKLLKT